MEARYDKANDCFSVDGKQLYWSSIYVLTQKSTDLKTLTKRLQVSPAEESLFKEELDDLRSLGFIKGKAKISVTPAGSRFLRSIKHGASFKGLREKGVRDIDKVMAIADRLEHMDSSKTRAAYKPVAEHRERVDWFSIFVNSALGLFTLLAVMLIAFTALGSMTLDAFIVQLTMAPIAAVFLIGSATIVMWLLYYGGWGIGELLFRHK